MFSSINPCHSLVLIKFWLYFCHDILIKLCWYSEGYQYLHWKLNVFSVYILYIYSIYSIYCRCEKRNGYIYCTVWKIRFTRFLLFLLCLLDKKNAMHLLVFCIFSLITFLFSSWRKKHFIDHQTAFSFFFFFIQLFSYLLLYNEIFLVNSFLNKSQGRGIPQRFFDKCSRMFICILLK